MASDDAKAGVNIGSVNRPSVKVSPPRRGVSLQGVEVLADNAPRHKGVGRGDEYFSSLVTAAFSCASAAKQESTGKV